jgi:hypothetical protein
MTPTVFREPRSRAAVLLPALCASTVLLLVLEWPAGLMVLLLASLIPLGLLVDYRKAYLVWLFTLPFLRNFINIRTPLFDLKPSYLLLFVVMVGWLQQALRQRTLGLPSAKEFKLLYAALALLVGVTILAVAVSSSPWEGLRAIPRTLYVAAVVLATLRVLDSHEASRDAVKVCSKSLAALIALGFVFYFTSVLPSGYVIDMNQGWPPSVKAVSSELGQAYELGDQASFVHRYSTGFGNLYDTTGDFALVGAFLFLGWAGSRKWQDHVSSPWLWILMCTAALLLTYSRGAWICAAIGLLVLFALPRGQWRLRSILLLIVLLAIWLSPKTVTERLMTVDASIFSRATRILFSLEIIQAHPVLGVGPGVFSNLLTGMQGNWQELGVDPNEPVSAHSAILQYAGEQGLVGLATLLFFFSIYIVIGFRLTRRVRGSDGQLAVPCAVFAAFVAFLVHCLALPNFEDFLWAIYAIGFVLAVQAVRTLQPSPAAIH